MFFIANKKEYGNRFYYLKSERQKLLLKSLLASCFFEFDYKCFFQKIFVNFNKKSSISFYRNRCLANNWSRCVFRKFKMSRHQSKAFASFGLITGLRKSSF